MRCHCAPLIGHSFVVLVLEISFLFPTLYLSQDSSVNDEVERVLTTTEQSQRSSDAGQRSSANRTPTQQLRSKTPPNRVPPLGGARSNPSARPGAPPPPGAWLQAAPRLALLWPNANLLSGRFLCRFAHSYIDSSGLLSTGAARHLALLGTQIARHLKLLGIQFCYAFSAARHLVLGLYLSSQYGELLCCSLHVGSMTHWRTLTHTHTGTHRHHCTRTKTHWP